MNNTKPMDFDAGISRIDVQPNKKGRGAYRFEVANDYQSYIDKVYNYVFDLKTGSVSIPTGTDSVLGTYDTHFGIDTILRLSNGNILTVQEKVLTTTFDTVTIEYYQDCKTKEPGDWFTIQSDLYFVGYTSNDSNNFDLRCFILLNLPIVKSLSSVINWQERQNKKDGAMASFKYARFDEFPNQAIVAMNYNGIKIANSVNGA